MFVISTLGLAWLLAASRRSAWACRAIAFILIPTALIVASCGTGTPLSSPTDSKAFEVDEKILPHSKRLCSGSTVVELSHPGGGPGYQPGQNGYQWSWVSIPTADQLPSKVLYVNPSFLAKLQFSKAGTYKLRLVRFSGGILAETLAGWNITITENQSPTAQLSGPSAGLVNTELTFEASGNDPDGDSISYEWEMPGAIPAPSNSAVAVVRYPTRGTYRVRVRVLDLCGGVSDWATTNVVIGDSTPGELSAAFSVWDGTVRIDNPYNQSAPVDAELGLKVTFDSSLSTGAIHRRYWYFSDGTTSTAEKVEKQFSAAGASYAATLLLYDSAYNPSSISRTINVGQAHPVVSSLPGPGFRPIFACLDGTDVWAFSDQGKFGLANVSSPGTLGTTSTMVVMSTDANHNPIPVLSPISVMDMKFVDNKAALDPNRKKLLVARGLDGLDIFRANPDNFTLLKHLDYVGTGFADDRIVSIAAVGNLAFAAARNLRDGAQPADAAPGSTLVHNGILVYDISNPLSPALVDAVSLEGITSLASVDDKAIVAHAQSNRLYVFQIIPEPDAQSRRRLVERNICPDLELTLWSQIVVSGKRVAVGGTTKTIVLDVQNLDQANPDLWSVSGLKYVPSVAGQLALSGDRMYFRDYQSIRKFNIASAPYAMWITSRIGFSGVYPVIPLSGDVGTGENASARYLLFGSGSLDAMGGFAACRP